MRITECSVLFGGRKSNEGAFRTLIGRWDKERASYVIFAVQGDVNWEDDFDPDEMISQEWHENVLDMKRAFYLRYISNQLFVRTNRLVAKGLTDLSNGGDIASLTEHIFFEEEDP